MHGGVAIGGPEVGHQHVIAAEDVERQVAVSAVVPVEEGGLLVAVERRVGGVKIKGQLCGAGRAVPVVHGGDELVDQHTGEPADVITGDTTFKPTERRGRAQWLAGLKRCAGGQLQRRVVAQGLLIIEVFITLSQTDDPLPQKRALLVLDQVGIARVAYDLVKSLDKAGAQVRLA